VRRGIEEFQAGSARGDPGAVFDSGIIAPDAEWIPPSNTPGSRLTGRFLMRKWIRSHVTYANVMVTILAFVVLGSMTYSATGGNEPWPVKVRSER
jgi:hypothetical protein